MKNKNKKLFITFYNLLIAGIAGIIATTIISIAKILPITIITIIFILCGILILASFTILIVSFITKRKEKEDIKKNQNLKENNTKHENIFCLYCGCKIKTNETKCPNCGATIKN